MKIIVPMAGAGTRFSSEGITTPKPLIEVGGRPMVAWAMDGLADVPRTSTLFVVLAAHERKYGVRQILRSVLPEPHDVIVVPEVTAGQLVTVLAAREFIDHDEAVLVASADTYVRSELWSDICRLPPESHGLISVARMPGDRWSFARVDASGRVVEVAEKRRISELASTGLYYFSDGAELVAVGEEMVRDQRLTRGEFYIVPVYQRFIDDGWRVDISEADLMLDMGTPAALEEFKRRMLSGE